MNNIDQHSLIYDPVSKNQFRIDDGPWLHFNGSVGDLYFIASLLHKSPLATYGFKLLCPLKYYSLLKSFIIFPWKDNTIFCHPDDLTQIIRDKFIISSSRQYNTSLIFRMGGSFPSHYIYSPLLCDHPAIASLVESGHIKSYTAYGLCLLIHPNLSKPLLPCYSNPRLKSRLNHILSNLNISTSKSILFNPVNHTHSSFSLENLKSIISYFEARNIALVFNTAQASSDILNLCSSLSYTIDIPIDMIPMVQAKFPVVAGITGGAISIASSFTPSRVITLHTQNNHNKLVIAMNSYQEIAIGDLGFDFFPGIGNYYEHNHGRSLVINCLNKPISAKLSEYLNCVYQSYCKMPS